MNKDCDKEYLDIYQRMYNAHWEKFWNKRQSTNSRYQSIANQVKHKIFWACIINLGGPDKSLDIKNVY